MTKKGNDLYNCIEHAPELVITASKGKAQWIAWVSQ